MMGLTMITSWLIMAILVELVGKSISATIPSVLNAAAGWTASYNNDVTSDKTNHGLGSPWIVGKISYSIQSTMPCFAQKEKKRKKRKEKKKKKMEKKEGKGKGRK